MCVGNTPILPNLPIIELTLEHVLLLYLRHFPYIRRAHLYLWLFTMGAIAWLPQSHTRVEYIGDVIRISIGVNRPPTSEELLLYQSYILELESH